MSTQREDKQPKRRRTISLQSTRAERTCSLMSHRLPKITVNRSTVVHSRCETEPTRKKKTSVSSKDTCKYEQDKSKVPPVECRPSSQTDLTKRGFIVKSSLGAGSYSKVKRAIDIKELPETEVAIKIIDRYKTPKDYQIKFLPRELKIWSRLKHPNLIALLDCFEENYRVYMVLEYAPDGDALKYIQKYGALTDEVARSWMQQIVSAVQYMHANLVAHRDLKLENLLLTNRAKQVKLSDFGFVKSVARCDLSHTFCGSKAYAAPEILEGRSYDPRKGDVWALGVILYIISTGKMPFDETRGTAHIIDEQSKLNFYWKRLNCKNMTCQPLIMRMFTWDFKHRPSINTITKDPWLQSPSKLI